MTKEQYIERLIEELDVPKDIAEKVFQARYKYDWAVFCSYMADDRDHPEERVSAMRVKKSELKDLDKRFVTLIESFMHEDAEYSIHKMK